MLYLLSNRHAADQHIASVRGEGKGILAPYKKIPGPFFPRLPAKIPPSCTPENERPGEYMSRKIDIAFRGSISRIALRRVDRSKLYGSTRRIGLDAKGCECASALLTHDGRHVLGPGSTAGMYLNEKGDMVAREDLTAADEQGRPAGEEIAFPDSPHELTGPVPAEALLECMVTAVYEVDASDLDSTLAASLSQGDIYHALNKGFLLTNEHGVFLLATKPARFDFVGRDHQTAFDDDDDHGFDDLGFDPM